MKNTFIVSSILLLLALSCFASEENPEAAWNSLEAEMESSQPKAPSQSNFLLGARRVHFEYQEPDFMKTDGYLDGITGSYFYRWVEGIMFRTDGEYLTGNTHYEGGLQDNYGNQSDYKSEDKFRVINLSGVGMFRSRISDSFATNPFLGLGYRNTFDGKDGPYDYRRDITYYYMILGAQLELINNTAHVLLMNLELDSLVGGQAKSYLSDVDSRYPDPENEFRGGSAYKVGIEYYHTLPTIGKVMAEISYKKWQVGESKPVAYQDRYFVEPENKTTLTSLSLGLFF